MSTTQIKKLTATVSTVRDLSPTAKELVLVPSEPLDFVAGSFVNIFSTINGSSLRRAYSISSSDQNTQHISLSVRLTPDGQFTPLLWESDYTGKTLELMGPLGLNTADKLTKRKVFLFGFGIGAGVVRAIALRLIERNDLDSLVIMTGSRNENDMVHKTCFDELAEKDPRVKTAYVLSAPTTQTPYPRGYIQDHLSEFDFNDADVYVCGQGVACDDLIAKIKSFKPKNCDFFVEDFH